MTKTKEKTPLIYYYFPQAVHTSFYKNGISGNFYGKKDGM